MPDFEKVMAEIHAANEAHGVNVRGGKKYLEVAKRVEIFRKHYGMSAGIETHCIHFGTVKGEPVAMRAVITDDKERVIATGTASEVIGDGNVNRASALENAETSAIGRALATLGLHGGEFASLNEMEAIGQKPDNPATQDLIDAWEQGVLDKLPDEPSAEGLSEAYADQIEADVLRYKTNDGLDGYMRKHADHLRFIENHNPERYGTVRAAVLAQRDTFKGETA